MLRLEPLLFIIYNLLFHAGKDIVVSAALFATPAQKEGHNLDKCCPLISVELDHGCWLYSRSAWLMCPLGFLGLPQCYLDPLPFKKHESHPCIERRDDGNRTFSRCVGINIIFLKNLTGFILYCLDFKSTFMFKNAFLKC